MNRLSSIVLALVSVVSLLTVSTASAQRRRSFAFDATLGIGHGHGGEFRSRDIGGPRLATSVRTGPQGRVGAFAELAMDWVQLHPRQEWEIRGGVGGAAYRVDGLRVGGALAQLDVALFPARRIGIVGGVRAVVVPRYRKDQLSTFPWLLGLRVR